MKAHPFLAVRLRLALVMLAAATLASCASSNSEPPTLSQIVAEPPASFLAAAPTQAGSVDDRWWNRFGDPLLTRYVERAVESSPAVLQAIARLEQAGAAARIARADLFPQLSAGLDVSRSRQRLGRLERLCPSLRNGIFEEWISHHLDS